MKKKTQTTIYAYVSIHFLIPRISKVEEGDHILRTVGTPAYETGSPLTKNYIILILCRM